MMAPNLPDNGGAHLGQHRRDELHQENTDDEADVACQRGQHQRLEDDLQHDRERASADGATYPDLVGPTVRAERNRDDCAVMDQRMAWQRRVPPADE